MLIVNKDKNVVYTTYAENPTESYKFTRLCCFDMDFRQVYILYIILVD